MVCLQSLSSSQYFEVFQIINHWGFLGDKNTRRMVQKAANRPFGSGSDSRDLRVCGQWVLSAVAGAQDIRSFLYPSGPAITVSLEVVFQICRKLNLKAQFVGSQLSPRAGGSFCRASKACWCCCSQGFTQERECVCVFSVSGAPWSVKGCGLH